MVVAINLFAIFSPYGLAAALLLFGLTMAIMPPVLEHDRHPDVPTEN